MRIRRPGKSSDFLLSVVTDNLPESLGNEILYFEISACDFWKMTDIKAIYRGAVGAGAVGSATLLRAGRATMKPALMYFCYGGF